MRKLLVVGAALAASACSATPPAAPVVSWHYGAGNGDGVSYQGAAPRYSRAYAPGNGDGVTSGQQVKENYAYGGENQSGTMVQTTPQAQQQKQMQAAPAQPQQGQNASRTHS